MNYWSKTGIRYFLGAILMTPFLQFGFSYYISISLAIFLLIIYISRAVFTKKYFGLKSVLKLISLFGLLSLPYIFEGIDTRMDFLRMFKDVFFLSVLFYLFKNRIQDFPNHANDLFIKIKFVLNFISVALFFMVLIQRISISLSRPILINPTLLGRNSDNVAIESNYFLFDRLRPSGTFGEPSYLSWYSFFLICSLIYFHRLLKNRMDILFIALNFGSILMSQSGLGITFLFLVLLLKGVKSSFDVLVRFLALATIVLVTFFTYKNFLVGQLSITFDFRSWNTRVQEPASLYKPFLDTFPFGIPLRRVFSSIDPFVFENRYLFELIGNGISYLIFGYGIIGILLIAALFVASRNLDLLAFLFFLFSFFQNGSFLDFDKSALMIILVLFSRLRQSDVEN